MNQNDVAEAKAFMTQRIGIWAGITAYDREAWTKYKCLVDDLWCPVGAKTKTIKAAEWPVKNSFKHGILRSFTGTRWRQRIKPTEGGPVIEDGARTRSRESKTVEDSPGVIRDQAQEILGRHEPDPENPKPSGIRPSQDDEYYWTFKWSLQQTWSLRWSARQKAFVVYSLNGKVLRPELEYPKETSDAAYLKRGGSIEVGPFAPIITPVIDTGIYQRHLDLLEARLQV
jgi:hypothetical protein